MGLTGWVKNHREILDHWVSQDPHMFALWQRLILEANHQETKKMFNGALTTIRRGELVFGLEAWEAKTGISKKILRRCLKTLEDEGMVGRQRTNKCSIISIVNYDKYQTAGSQEAGEGQAEGKQRASKGQHRKNVKNVENDKNKDIGASAIDYSEWPETPSDQVFADWVQMRKRKKANVTQTVINRFAKQLKIAKGRGYSVDDCLTECIVRNWTGFEADWMKGGGTYTDPLARDTRNDDKNMEFQRELIRMTRQ